MKMTKAEAKIIAKTITNEELFDMFNNAKSDIIDWNVRSTINKGFSLGVSWNVLAKGFDLNYQYNYISKWNMVREFGEFLPKYLRVKMKKRKPLDTFMHQEPNFKNWE